MPCKPCCKLGHNEGSESACALIILCHTAMWFWDTKMLARDDHQGCSPNDAEVDVSTWQSTKIHSGSECPKKDGRQRTGRVQ